MKHAEIGMCLMCENEDFGKDLSKIVLMTSIMKYNYQ